ncbi:MAG: hypothetical protein IPO08_21800 [Xanthomonadales bacterium]|nr:hypothetical protein [Xanthomonadales bacterium]
MSRAAWRSTLGDELPREMARVRDEVLGTYLELGPPGAVAAVLMRRDLDDAAQALAEGDVRGMLRALSNLRRWSL